LRLFAAVKLEVLEAISARTTGATFVPSNSTARSIFWCGMEPTPICNKNR
jgi:hypothetical protein